MIITENVILDNTEFVYTYSDAGCFIRQDGTGDLYESAYDPADSGRTYTETDIPIDGEGSDEATVEDYQEALKELGVEVDE